MLRISRLADYATVLMAYLARHQSQLHNAKTLAQHVHLTVPTVSKLLKLLANADLLTSQRGVNGGYSLAKPAHEISIADILAAVEGPSGLTNCSHANGECFLEGVCLNRSNWRLISEAITSALKSVSLEAFAQANMSIAAVDVNQIKKIGIVPRTDMLSEFYDGKSSK